MYFREASTGAERGTETTSTGVVIINSDVTNRIQVSDSEEGEETVTMAKNLRLNEAGGV